ncbi:dethiobiotin synthase [Aurantibacter crassamenti]|uniref:dethiobiotin synthase n=1 Tax=Aurantibacter crassamenti TaxID=1837375 RepID=UPI001939BB2F|nr:dethiobiotin synthase [Aurantibacter crassamenti]MBM1104860.1 dethiobiotin synthase [Aurantibacter crassamenti]
MKRIFITGISTDVGKTIASAIIVEALEADYWKPVQAGDLDATDSDSIRGLITNSKTVIHESSYELTTAMSPHAAAEIDGIRIEHSNIIEPQTENSLVIEGAGGLLVPLNEEETVLDIIMPNYKVIVVSRHYLGSINHSLMTINWLVERGYNVAVLFNGKEHPTTENIIASKTGVTVLGRIDEETTIDKAAIRRYADKFRSVIQAL